ncbi:hypothetical protein ALC62_05887 [Cyphomyrmex costatus]|uniref:Uncharacterized protein n=1 Tax=Cyphomyrmex costatus TaxID=456900 RepID=A0A195CSX1_9HYME|nr:hypothetical protein ALC62_05887 [Cyphomyrmex costatus]
MKPLSINAGGDLRRNLSMRVYRIACAFANCIHTRSHRSPSVIVAEFKRTSSNPTVRPSARGGPVLERVGSSQSRGCKGKRGQSHGEHPAVQTPKCGTWGQEEGNRIMHRVFALRESLMITLGSSWSISFLLLSYNAASAAARWPVIRLTGNRPLRGGCDEGSRLRGARVAQAPVEEYRKDAAFLESLIKPAAASNHRRKHRRLQLPARRLENLFKIFLLKNNKKRQLQIDSEMIYNRDEVADNYLSLADYCRRRYDNFDRSDEYNLAINRPCGGNDVALRNAMNSHRSSLGVHSAVRGAKHGAQCYAATHRPDQFKFALLPRSRARDTPVDPTPNTECLFPAKWEGAWFQSGVRQSILISKNELSTKGRCLHNEGDKYLLVDQKSCYRCVVIHEKHSNVLQYKETFCHSRNSLASLCSYITGDALLYSMFREEALPVACPFRGPMTFSYNRGHGTCSNPPSNVDTCTDDSRLLFKYQACPDVPASESAVEELECLATWKEGSSRYLVGRLHHGHASSNEDRYRCFVYEKAGQAVQGNLNRAAMGMGTMDHEVALPGGPVPEGSAEVYRVAQSGDATCNGLFSPMEGSRTMTLRKVSSPGECRFPNWLTGHSNGGLTWHTLDLGRSYTFHPRNASLHVTRPNTTSSSFEGGSMDLQYVPGPEDQDVKILCNSIKQSNGAQTMMTMTLVAHFTVGCRSGFMCMTFYRRDGHVIELQTGSAVSRPEEACSSPHFLQHSTPFLTLPTTSWSSILAR